MSTDQPTGRVAVVTGASSGIGEATARAFAAAGLRVALLARRADRIQTLADELGEGAIAIEADVTDRASVVTAADRVQHELGGADILVNNAGVMLAAPSSSYQREDHRRMVETNLLGAATEVFLDQLTPERSQQAIGCSSGARARTPALSRSPELPETSTRWMMIASNIASPRRTSSKAREFVLRCGSRPSSSLR